MPQTVLALDEVQLKIKDLRTAITLERDRHYTNLQGKKLRFSQFLYQTVSVLIPFAEGGPDAQTLLRYLGQYDYMDLAGRIKSLDKTERLLDSMVLTATAQRPKTIMRNQQDTTPDQTQVQYVKGVGPRMAEMLHKANINTVQDLLYYFPRRHLDYNTRLKIAQLIVGQEATLIGDICQVGHYKSKTKDLTIATVTIQDETGVLTADWMFAKMSRPMLESFLGRYAKGTQVMMSGKVKWDKYKNRLGMSRPEVEILSYANAEASDSDDPGANSLNAGRLVPVYPLVQGLNLKLLRKAIRHALDDFLEGMADPLPQPIQKRYSLPNLQTALMQMHFPETFTQYEAARRRLVFDELFYIQVRLALIRSQYKRHVQGNSLSVHTEGLVSRFLAMLPFQLTGAQRRVWQEIQADMTSVEPMYRLLQGDVGSGKTVIALLTLLTAVENGYQGVLMAPTEILAEQHYRNFIQWLTPLGLKVALFTGRATAGERRQLRQGLLNGQIHVAVGTQALIQDGVEFDRLGATVVDEQHRFGVRQRVLLKSKGDNPEMLTMTATPIPRTLAMTLHGDLDVSLLDELPPGRTPIRTGLYKGKGAREECYKLIRHEITQGRQAYVVLPLIEDSETISAKSATAEYETLCKTVFPQFNIGLLHGKLSSDEKESVMQDFIHRKLHILVSTTVIEVGVDIPNATVMMIENADRFGLAQLHQLRGRVGRGAQQSFCLLMTDSRTPETLERLNILVESTDGFYLAERDLELRGPGEFLGTRQSGLPDLLLTDLINDKAILDDARQAAFDLVEHSSDLSAYPELHDSIFTKTDEKFNVVNAG